MTEDFAASRGAGVLARFTEVESGRKADRLELAKALHLAKFSGATLLIAKLDRLSRNAAVCLAIRDSGVSFLAVDMLEANDLTVGIVVLVAQAEREAISRRAGKGEWLFGRRSRPTRYLSLRTWPRCSQTSVPPVIHGCVRLRPNSRDEGSRRDGEDAWEYGTLVS